MTKILFICGGRRVSLLERFYNCTIYNTDIDELAPTKLVSHEYFPTPSFKNRVEFVACINEFCEKYFVDAIIPLYDDAIDICCDAKLSAKWFGPDRKTNDLFFSKRETIKFFNSLGLLSPQEAFDYSGDKIVGRDLNGCGSKGLHFVNSKEEFQASNVLYKNSIYTNYIKGIEYTIDCYKDANAQIIGVIPRIRLKVRSGEVLISKTIKHEKIIEQATLIMKNINVLGPCTLQCIEDDSGDLWWIEGNPRFGGGVILSMEAGADYTKCVINDIYGLKNDPIIHWQENLIMTRADREFFIYA